MGGSLRSQGPSCPPQPARRLMVNLTQPALLCFGKVPADAASRHHFLQVLSYLQAYKEVRLPGEGPLGGWGSLLGAPRPTWGSLQAFASEKVFGVLSEKLYDLLQLVSPVSPRSSWGLSPPGGSPRAPLTAPSPQDWEQRQEEDTLLIERILLLLRNVLHVPPDPAEEQVPGHGPSPAPRGPPALPAERPPPAVPPGCGR